MDDALQILLDKQACVELVYRFARGLDRCDEAIVRSVFHADGTDDHGQFKGTVDEFVAWVFPVLATMERTQHVIGNVLVEVDGDDLGPAPKGLGQMAQQRGLDVAAETVVIRQGGVERFGNDVLVGDSAQSLAGVGQRTDPCRGGEAMASAGRTLMSPRAPRA